MPAANDSLTQMMGLFGSLTESLKTMSELVARIDERVKLLAERNDRSDLGMKDVLDSQNKLLHRVITLEAKDWEEQVGRIDNLLVRLQDVERKCDHLERTTSTSEARWKTIMDISFRVAEALVIAFLLYRLGLQ